MKFAHYQSAISPHVIPLIQGVVDQLGENEVRYVYESEGSAARVKLGWNYAGCSWTLNKSQEPTNANAWLEHVPVLMCGFRDLDLFERRSRRGLTTIYSSECWFKPISVLGGRFHLSGWLRLLSPYYFSMVRRFVHLLNRQKSFCYFPIGVHAAREAIHMVELFSQGIRSLFKPSSRMTIEPGPYGRINGNDQIRMAVYTVASSTCQRISVKRQNDGTLKILWVGRMLEWKRVDTIIAAVRRLVDGGRKVQLTLAGMGECENRLRRLAKDLPVNFTGPVKLDQVRKLMREADVYVLASTGQEGWGAVVNECLEEGCPILGTFEAGGSATILPESNLFHAGDVEGLYRKLRSPVRLLEIGEWRADLVAKRLVSIMEGRW